MFAARPVATDVQTMTVLVLSIRQKNPTCVDRALDHDSAIRHLYEPTNRFHGIYVNLLHKEWQQLFPITGTRKFKLASEDRPIRKITVAGSEEIVDCSPSARTVKPMAHGNTQ